MSLEKFARLCHDLYGATRANSDEFQRRDPSNTLEPQGRRQTFCREVSQQARSIHSQLVSNPTWRRLFNPSKRVSAIRHELEKKESLSSLVAAAGQLEKVMKSKLCANAKNSDPLLVVQFDKASTLIETQEDDKEPVPNPAQYIALNRIISCLKVQPIWFFFLSTDSKIRLLVPPDNQPASGSALKDNSVREIDGRKAPDRLLMHFPPFIYFCMDIDHRLALSDTKQRRAELCKSLAQIADLRHLAT
jgi:hypothetical protein